MSEPEMRRRVLSERTVIEEVSVIEWGPYESWDEAMKAMTNATTHAPSPHTFHYDWANGTTVEIGGIMWHLVKVVAGTYWWVGDRQTITRRP